MPPGNLFPEASNTYNLPSLCPTLGIDDSFALKTNEETIELYHFTEADLVAAQRILFTQGGYDPVTAVGPPPLPLSDDRDATRTVLMYGNANTEEAIGNSLGDHTETVKEVGDL